MYAFDIKYTFTTSTEDLIENLNKFNNYLAHTKVGTNVAILDIYKQLIIPDADPDKQEVTVELNICCVSELILELNNALKNIRLPLTSFHPQNLTREDLSYVSRPLTPCAEDFLLFKYGIGIASYDDKQEHSELLAEIDLKEESMSGPASCSGLGMDEEEFDRRCVEAGKRCFYDQEAEENSDDDSNDADDDLDAPFDANDPEAIEAAKMLDEISRNPDSNLLAPDHDPFEPTLEDEYELDAAILASYEKEPVYDPTQEDEAEEKDYTAPEDDDPTPPLEKLQAMIGLQEVKNTIAGIIAQETFNIKRARLHLPKISSNMHMCFMGNPGTAKTTVARLLAKIFYEKGIIKSNTFVECGRTDLVDKYIGHTAKNVREKFEEATGGILFIDEAYALATSEENPRDFGKEAIDTLVQEMENRRDNVIVIFAGYEKEMQFFMDRNPGLGSRISYKLNFEDYSSKELLEIFHQMAETQKFIYDDAVSEEILHIVEQAKEQKNFGNGRFMRTLLEKACRNMAMRLTEDQNDVQSLSKLEVSDFQGLYVSPEAKAKAEPKPEPEKVISFKLPHLPELAK